MENSNEITFLSRQVGPVLNKSVQSSSWRGRFFSPPPEGIVLFGYLACAAIITAVVAYVLIKFVSNLFHGGKRPESPNSETPLSHQRILRGLRRSEGEKKPSDQVINSIETNVYKPPNTLSVIQMDRVQISSVQTEQNAPLPLEKKKEITLRTQLQPKTLGAKGPFKKPYYRESTGNEVSFFSVPYYRESDGKQIPCRFACIWPEIGALRVRLDPIWELRSPNVFCFHKISDTSYIIEEIEEQVDLPQSRLFASNPKVFVSLSAIDPSPNYTIKKECKSLRVLFNDLADLLDSVPLLPTSNVCREEDLQRYEEDLQLALPSRWELYRMDGNPSKTYVRVEDIDRYIRILSLLGRMIIYRRKEVFCDNLNRATLFVLENRKDLQDKKAALKGKYVPGGRDKFQNDELSWKILEEKTTWRPTGWDGQGSTTILCEKIYETEDSYKPSDMYRITMRKFPIEYEWEGKLVSKTFTEWDMSVIVPFLRKIQERIDHLAQFLHPYSEIRLFFENQLKNYPTQKELLIHIMKTPRIDENEKIHPDECQDYTLEMNGESFCFCRKVLKKQLELAKNQKENKIDLNKLCIELCKNWFQDVFPTKLFEIVIYYLYKGRSEDKSPTKIRSLEFNELCGLIIISDFLQYTHLSFLCELELIARLATIDEATEDWKFAKQLPLSEETKREMQSTYILIDRSNI